MSDEPEEELSWEAPPFPDWADEDEQRRAFVLAQFANFDGDDFALFERRARGVAFLKDGVVPSKPKLVK